MNLKLSLLGTKKRKKKRKLRWSIDNLRFFKFSSILKGGETSNDCLTFIYSGRDVWTIFVEQRGMKKQNSRSSELHQVY